MHEELRHLVLKVNKIGNSNLFGIVLSLLCFAAVFILTICNPEERYLNEGAKELVCLINAESFFLLHPERLFFVLSQVFPLIGIKLGASLETIFMLHNLSLFFYSIIIYIICAWGFKDYFAGVFLSSFQVVGISFIFWTQPFLEPIYILLFCYLLQHIFRKYAFSNNKKWLLIIIPLIFFIQTLHPPLAILFVAIVVSTSEIPLLRKFVFGIFSITILFAILQFSEVSISIRYETLNLFKSHFLKFIKDFPDVVILLSFTSFFLFSTLKKWHVWPVFALCLLPIILYRQVPLGYITLPCGFCLLYLANKISNKKNVITIILVICIFVFNIKLVNDALPNYQTALTYLNQIIDTHQNEPTSKFILMRDRPNAEQKFFTYTFSLEETIKHSSLLYSTLNKDTKPIIIESLDFNSQYYNKSDSLKTNEEIIAFINQLYEINPNRQLYPERQHQYEYSKYYFTNHHINKKYFDIDLSGEYKVLEY